MTDALSFCNSQFLIERKLATTLKQIWCLTTPCFINLSTFISLFLWKDKINTEISASVDLLVLAWYSEMECKEDYRKVMAACGRKVYDNYKYITPWPEVA